MVQLVHHIHQEVTVKHKFGSCGSPWEFNLRDLLRWCSLIESALDRGSSAESAAKHFLAILFSQRFRTAVDRDELVVLMQGHGFGITDNVKPSTQIQTSELSFGWARLPRRPEGSC